MPFVPARATKEASDGLVVSLAAGQHGVVARRQLLAAGVGPGAITERLQSGLLAPIHRGVYAVGGARPSAMARLMAATLVAGGANIVSHRSAAYLHGLLSLSAGPIHITTTDRTRRRPSIRVHHVRAIETEDLGTIDGIACTAVPRTLVDLAATASSRTVEQALDQAAILRLYDGRAIDRALRAYRPGRRALRDVMARHAAGSTVTAGELEERFLALCRAADLPPAELNAPIARGDGRTAIADALWRRERLIVELDGRSFHDTASAFEGDRSRDVDLHVEGWLVLRFTWRQVTREADWVVARVRRALARRRGSSAGPIPRPG